jgi:hypothetical protein
VLQVQLDDFSQTLTDQRTRTEDINKNLVLEMQLLKKQFQSRESEGRLPGDTSSDKVNSVKTTEQLVMKIIREDLVGKADFAALSGGARIIREKTSPTWWGQENSSWWSTFYSKSNPPEEALRPSFEAGSCWPCRISDCRLSIRLAAVIKITHISLEHLSPHLAIRPAAADTAPKRFLVKHGDFVLGEYEYRRSSDEVVQTFVINSSSQRVLEEITFDFQSVHGRKSPSACIYRVRVHGDFVSAT